MYCIVLHDKDEQLKVLGPYNTEAGAQRVMERLFWELDSSTERACVLALEDE